MRAAAPAGAEGLAVHRTKAVIGSGAVRAGSVMVREAALGILRAEREASVRGRSCWRAC